jgi:hypothetical protein
MISYNGFINLKPSLLISKDGKSGTTTFYKPKSFFNNKDTHTKLLFLLDNEYEIDNDLINTTSEEYKRLHTPIDIYNNNGINIGRLNNLSVIEKIKLEQDIKDSKKMIDEYKEKHTKKEVDERSISVSEYSIFVENLEEYYKYLNNNRNNNNNYNVKILLDIFSSFTMSKKNSKKSNEEKDEDIIKKMCGYRYTKHLLSNEFVIIDIFNKEELNLNSKDYKQKLSFNSLFSPILKNKYNLFVDGLNIGIGISSKNNKNTILRALFIESSISLNDTVSNALNLVNYILMHKISIPDHNFNNVILTFNVYYFMLFIKELISIINKIIEKLEKNLPNIRYDSNIGILSNDNIIIPINQLQIFNKIFSL